MGTKPDMSEQYNDLDVYKVDKASSSDQALVVCVVVC